MADGPPLENVPVTKVSIFVIKQFDKIIINSIEAEISIRLQRNGAKGKLLFARFSQSHFFNNFKLRF